MLNELRDEIYSDAAAHGLWDGDYFKGEEITFDVENSEHCLKYEPGRICLKCKYDSAGCCIAVNECPTYKCPRFMEEKEEER